MGDDSHESGKCRPSSFIAWVNTKTRDGQPANDSAESGDVAAFQKHAVAEILHTPIPPADRDRGAWS